MYVSRSRTLTVDMGDYETYKFDAMVGLGHGDIGYTDEDMQSKTREESDQIYESLVATVLERLDALLQQEVLDAAELSIRKTSFIFRASARSQKPKKPEARVRRVRPRA